MTEKRYTVFISSTYEDLKEERKAVQDVILRGGDFPVQMEYFPATDEDQLEFIKPLIEQCDYYVLIIGGRYGTPTADGTSYTEKEFRHAVEKGLTIIVMLHGAPGEISVVKTEDSSEGKKRLKDFIRLAEQGRIRRTWTNIPELQLEVTTALNHAKKTKPSVGWLRGDKLTKVEALEELEKLRRENAKYRKTIGHLEVELALPPLPEAGSEIEIELVPTPQPSYGAKQVGYAKIRTSWIDVFPTFHSNTQWVSNDWGDEWHHHLEVEESLIEIGSAIASEFAEFDTKGLYQITKSTFNRLLGYYVEVGLANDEGKRPFTEAGDRTARRYSIAKPSRKPFSVVQGEVSIKQITLQDTEEIPF